MFWNLSDLEPKRSYRFRLQSKKGLKLDGKTASKFWWNAKKVDKPSFSVSTNKYRLINHEINVPGIVQWNPITIEIADIGETVTDLLEEFKKFGYAPNSFNEDKGLEKAKSLDFGHVGKLSFQQLDDQGTVIETWVLEGAFITELRLGNLDYSSDEIISINMTITYDYAYLD